MEGAEYQEEILSGEQPLTQAKRTVDTKKYA